MTDWNPRTNGTLRGFLIILAVAAGHHRVRPGRRDRARPRPAAPPDRVPRRDRDRRVPLLALSAGGDRDVVAPRAHRLLRRGGARAGRRGRDLPAPCPSGGPRPWSSSSCSSRARSRCGASGATSTRTGTEEPSGGLGRAGMRRRGGSSSALAVGLARASSGRRGGAASRSCPTSTRPRRRGRRQAGGRYVLVFGSAVDNVGRARSCSTPPGPARRRRWPWQLVSRRGGSAARAGRRTSLMYEQAETHAHWHLLGFERYELRSPRRRRRPPARKAGFCLGDRYDRSRAGCRRAGRPSGRTNAGSARRTPG